jgi:putative ABC transport system permease protein
MGSLRILGVTRGQLFAGVLREALLVGLLGSLLGLVAGWLIAQGLLGLVTRTINDLYFVLTVTQVWPGPVQLGKGLALGLLVTLLAALAPALEAARSSPLAARQRSMLERRAHRALPWISLAGLLIAATGLGIAALPIPSLLLGFVALFLLMVGISLLTPWALVGFARGLIRLLGSSAGGVGRLAARGLEAGLSRTGLAVAALAVAVSATVGVGVMISSFRTTVDLWLQQTLGADVYVSAPARSNSRASSALDPEAAAVLRSLPQIDELTSGRNLSVDTDHGPVELLALRTGRQNHRGTRFKQGDPETAWQQLRDGQGILISEPFAFHSGLGVGDRLDIVTERGPESFPVRGVFYDYSSSRGLVLMGRELYDAHWGDRAISSLGIYLEPGVDPISAAAAIRKALAVLPGNAEVSASAEIRELSLDIFDRTFAITQVLRLLVVGVAFVGILSALLALQLERTREHAILRALGLTPAGLTGLIGLQTLLMGLAAGLIAIPLGLLTADMLIDTINLRAFGWSMQTHVPIESLTGALLLSLGAAALAGLYPAWRLARMPPAEALHEE